MDFNTRILKAAGLLSTVENGNRCYHTPVTNLYTSKRVIRGAANANQVEQYENK